MFLKLARLDVNSGSEPGANEMNHHGRLVVNNIEID